MLNANTGKQLLQEIKHEITITMQGESLEDVTGKIFQAMRKQIFREINKPIIHLEAQEVYFDKVETKRTKEHFMLVFWERERVSYTVTARIIVRVKYLEINEEDL